MTDIFISYARADQARIAPLAQALKGAGFSVWWDQHLAGGETFSATIERELEAAKAVIVAWSAAAITSDWVKDEAATAKRADKLIPIGIDTSAPPLGFQQLHTINFSDWSGDPHHAAFVDLTTALHRLGLDARAVPAAKKAREQEVRFCQAADGVQIAYATVGEGPPLIKTANWMNHLEFDWESPVWRHAFMSLSENRRLIRYDQRGNGLSDWEIDDFSFDAMVADLEAVVDATGLDRFPLFGLSQGCAVSVEYAARHPEKVSKLILLGGYARGWNFSPSADIRAENKAMSTLMRTGWGKDNSAFRQMFTSIFMPDAPPENQKWFNELQRISISPENAARLLTELGKVNVADRLGDVKAPTLVAHCRGDMRIPFKAGRELAAGIPNARLVTLESNNHVMWEGDPAWRRFLNELNSFLGDDEASA